MNVRAASVNRAGIGRYAGWAGPPCGSGEFS
jgi:hypothetical protein